MSLFDSTTTIVFEQKFYAAVDRMTAAFNRCADIGVRIMADLSVLEAKVDSLTSKVEESATTLSGLKAEVIALRDALPPDQQGAVDAIVAKVDAALERLTSAEDDADDVLPAA